MTNADEIEFWDAEAGPRWAEFQEQIDCAFAPLGAAVLAAAVPRPAEVALDIGCGCGATSLELANAVGIAGSVLGIDVSRPMLSAARDRAGALGLTNIRFTLADAATHSFDEGAFDLAFSRFGVMFFDDPVGAFTNVRRALTPGGRLVFVCWRELAANPWFYVPVEAIRPHVPAQPKPEPNSPGPLSFADPNRVHAILEQAGFEDVRFEAFDANLSVGSRSSATDLLSKIGGAARLLADADERERAKAIGALDDALSTHEVVGDVVLGGGVWIVSARPARAHARN